MKKQFLVCIPIMASLMLAPSLIFADTPQSNGARDIVIIKEKKRMQKLNADQRKLILAKPQKPSRTLRIKVSTNKKKFKIGESMVIKVTPNQDAYITIIDHGTSGDSMQLFPNQFVKDRFVRANQTIVIPRPQDGYHYEVAGPTGSELIKVIASTDPGKFIPKRQLKGQKVFAQIKQPAQTLSRDIKIVMNDKRHSGKTVTAEHRIVIVK